ncbi:NUDIX hydrolase [Nocardia arthritidis]|nr:NUDIX hydrolase [Nocardia arthritidis]
MVDQSLLRHLIAGAERDEIQRLVVGAIVEYGDCVLLLRRPESDCPGGIWEPPGGEIESGESIDRALIRAVTQETGLVAAEISTYLGQFDYPSAEDIPARQFNFVVRVTAPEPIRLRAHDAHGWLELTEEPPVTDAVKKILDRYRAIRLPLGDFARVRSATPEAG